MLLAMMASGGASRSISSKSARLAFACSMMASTTISAPSTASASEPCQVTACARWADVQPGGASPASTSVARAVSISPRDLASTSGLLSVSRT